jgi:hypothetical protein
MVDAVFKENITFFLSCHESNIPIFIGQISRKKSGVSGHLSRSKLVGFYDESAYL